MTSYILGDQFPKSANLPTASCSVKSFLVAIENAKKDLSNNDGKIKDTTYMSILSAMSGILTISSYFTKNKKLSLAAGIVSVLSGLLAEFTENTNTTYIDDGLLFLYDKSTKLIDFFKNYYNELFEDLDRYLSQNCSNNILNLQIQNATCNETDGKIEFTITLNKALEKGVKLKSIYSRRECNCWW